MLIFSPRVPISRCLKLVPCITVHGAELTIWDEDDYVQEWQVPLDEEQTLHESPLGIPYEIEFHLESDEVVPDIESKGGDLTSCY